jgi:hypothetical protein
MTYAGSISRSLRWRRLCVCKLATDGSNSGSNLLGSLSAEEKPKPHLGVVQRSHRRLAIAGRRVLLRDNDQQVEAAKPSPVRRLAVLQRTAAGHPLKPAYGRRTTTDDHAPGWAPRGRRSGSRASNPW